MNKQTKKLVKAFVLIYIASFLIINWADVSWVFNYKEISGLVYDFFNPYPSIDASSMGVYFYPNRSSPQIPIGQIKTAYTDKTSDLEIPKISISVPVIFSESTDKASLTKDLDKGAVYYPGSVMPGQNGEIVIIGHSAPSGWPKIKYDWIFSDLDNLGAGDIILLDINNKQYTYIVKQKTIIKKGEEVNNNNVALNTNTLILISCWPPGKDFQRIAVLSELMKN